MTLIADVIPNLRTRKNRVRSMPKTSRLKGSFKKKHRKCAQRLLKCQGQLLYHIYWSLWRELSYKKSLLVICKMSTLFINTLSVNGKYSLVNRDNLTQPIQMQLSRKQKIFSGFIPEFLKSSLNFEQSLKKDDLHCWCISEIREPEKLGEINVEKVPFQGILRKATWQTPPNIVEICMAEPFPYLLMAVKAIVLQKVSVSDMQNLKTVY